MLTPVFALHTDTFSFWNGHHFPFIYNIPPQHSLPLPLLAPGAWGEKASSRLTRTGQPLCPSGPQLPGFLPWRPLPGMAPPLWPPQDWAPRLTTPSLLHLGEHLVYSKCSIPLAALISTINLHTDLNELSVVCFDLNYLIVGWIKIKSETKTEWKQRFPKPNSL